MKLKTLEDGKKNVERTIKNGEERGEVRLLHSGLSGSVEATLNYLNHTAHIPANSRT